MNPLMILLIMLCFPIMHGESYAAEKEIVCEGEYGGHLQGIALNAGNAIYWSFTVDLVKTDMTGELITSIPVENHHGDLVFRDNRVYVAVNLGQFNKEPGYADSWVYIYDANNLKFIERHKTPEVVHGAGGMTFCKGHFYVVGGLPEGYKENYVYEYDEKFNLIKRHTVRTGYTLMGIQTVCYALGDFWFGCYGFPDNKPLFRVSRSFEVKESSDIDFSVGIDMIEGNAFYRGKTWDSGDRKHWRGKIVRVGVVEISVK